MTPPRRHWSRLAPVARSVDFEGGLQGRVHDPLWLLSRQWQLREFEGADAGAPITVSVATERDPVSTVELRGDGEGEEGTRVPYEGGPLEPVIAREPVHTTGPGARLAAEAGREFRRFLDVEGYGSYRVEEFPEELHLRAPEAPMEASDRRYFRVMEGRALDGTRVFDWLAAAIDDINVVCEDDNPTQLWSGVDESGLPLPLGEPVTEEYRNAVLAYAEWYLTLHDEPTDPGATAWRPTRLEYNARVTTGSGENTAVFDVTEYPGGRLDRDAFVPVEDEEEIEGIEADAATGETTETSVQALPTHVDFPGMPNRRWWAFTDSSLMMSELAADGVNLARLLVLEYAVEYGADWYTVPVPAPIGSYVRVTDCTVRDSFGIELPAEPVTDENWQLYRSEPGGHDDPGLFLPPTLDRVDVSDPVEAVDFGRDELANLVFGIERIVEGPTGSPVDRTEFLVPQLEITEVQPAADPAEEFVVFQNPGEDSLDVHGYEVYAITVTADSEGRVLEETEPVFSFDSSASNLYELGPNEQVKLVTGQPSDENAIGAGLDASIWGDADALDVYDTDTADEEETGSGDSKSPGQLVVRRLLTTPDADGAYRLTSSVPAYWFPFTMTYDPENPQTVTDPAGSYRLKQAVLLDADTLDAPMPLIPRPKGRILDPAPETLPASEEALNLYEEEVTRSGVSLTRRYHLARWTDGSMSLWLGRKAENGAGELASGLRFDRLDHQ